MRNFGILFYCVTDAMNAGATVESSVVWSPKSFVPRSGSVDLTLDVFGQAVNLFEARESLQFYLFTE